MGTLGLFKDYGFAVQELVTRTLKGAEMRFEAVSIDGKLRFYWATPVRNESKDIVGVMLVEYGHAWLNQFQAVASQKLGRVLVTQYVENDKIRGVTVFDAGESKADISSAVTLPINDYWYLSYMPNSERPILGLFPLVAPWVGVLALIILILIALALLQKREVKRNQLMLLNYLRVLSRHGRAEEPPFTLGIFSELATRMLQILRAHKRIDNSNTAPAQALDIQLEPTRRAAIINRKAAPKEEGVMVEELDDDQAP
jgi:phosphomannomutase/phosphoglucomutase